MIEVFFPLHLGEVQLVSILNVICTKRIGPYLSLDVFSLIDKVYKIKHLAMQSAFANT